MSARGPRASRGCSIPPTPRPAGQELRLRQEYFFTSASLQDLLRRHRQQFKDARNLADKASIQLNDTHPAIAVAELMRLLMDTQGIAFDEAWDIVRATTSYTNHTLLPEALESWPIHLFERLLPRHMQIIYAINSKLIEEARAGGHGDGETLSAVSLIGDHDGGRVRMGQLAFVGSHKVNGVSALHTDLMKVTVFKHLNALYPDRINNKTNGITPRRWLQQVNPGLTQLLCETVGERLRDDVDALKGIERVAGDRGIPGALLPDQARQQGEAGQPDRAATGYRRRSGGAVRRADQAHPRV